MKLIKRVISGFRARSINLTVTAVMTGGTQLVEGAHLTGGDTRFYLHSRTEFWQVVNKNINMNNFVFRGLGSMDNYIEY